MVDPELKNYFAEQVRAIAALPDGPETERVLAAFRAVARERHAGPGPWLIRSPIFSNGARRTADDDPAHLYHDVLIALDEARGINIGQPSLWARLFQRTAIEPSARVLQVGAGSGYFTAILAELVGPSGHVLATEVDPALADMAQTALQDRPNAWVRSGSGVDLSANDGPFDLVVAFAGVTHPPAAWLDALSPDGRLLLPVTGEDWWGAMVLFENGKHVLQGTTLGRCGFFPCEGARDADVATALARFWANGALLDGAKIRLSLQDAPPAYALAED